jgi:hypothetical protein
VAISPAMLRTLLLVFLCAVAVQPAFAQSIGLDADGKPRIRAIKPGSELFVVYPDERNTTSDVLTRPGLVRGVKNRAFMVKINRLLQF